jgi:hypothetical protein
MPLAADPQQTYRITLDSDSSPSSSETPVFVCRYLTLRQWRQTARLYDEFCAVKDRDPDKFADKLMAILDQIIVSTTIPGGKPIDECVTVYEAMELLHKAWTGQRPDFEDKKKLSLPSDTGGANPAQTVPA